jgi:putative nucleotidyltransferase with HDIG domain
MSDDRQKRLKRLTERIIGLSALPTIVTQLIALVGDPRSSARQVARLISADQALTAKILRVANSAFYGFPRKIATVQLAIVVLGFNAVKNLAISVTVLKRFSAGTDHRLFDRQRFWQHAIGCGVAARMLAKRFGGRDGEAFVAGILHDIGKLILIEYAHDEFVDALELAEQDAVPIARAEEEVLGVTHAEVGGWLAERWNLPEPLAHSISAHHNPFALKEPDDLVLITHLADALVRFNEIGHSGDSQKPKLDPQVAARFKRGEDLTDEELLADLSDGLMDEIEKAQVFWDLGEDA